MTDPRPSHRERGNRRPRRSVATSATRQRILAAAVASLARRGVSDTTTVQIQADAGVSRGALLHQFPSREELLVAAVQHLAQQRFAALRAQPIDLEGPARVRRAVELLWSTYDGDLFWAAMHTWLAARSDPKLRQTLEPHERQLGRVVRGLCDDVFGEDIARHPRYPEAREVLITSMRGVALTYALDPQPPAEDPHVDSWSRLACQMLDFQHT